MVSGLAQLPLARDQSRRRTPTEFLRAVELQAERCRNSERFIQPAPATNVDYSAEMVQRPAFIEPREYGEFCRLCWKWGTEAHYRSDRHLRRVWWYQTEVPGNRQQAEPAPPVPAFGRPQGAAAHVEIAAIPNPPAGCPAWYTWNAEQWAWYCTLCWKNVDEKHLKTDKHLRKAAWAIANHWNLQPPSPPVQPPLSAQPPLPQGQSPPLLPRQQQAAPLPLEQQLPPPPPPRQQQYPPPQQQPAPPSSWEGLKAQLSQQTPQLQPQQQPTDTGTDRTTLLTAQLPQTLRPQLVQQEEPQDCPRDGSEPATAQPCVWERVQSDDGTGAYVFRNTHNGETQCKLPVGVGRYYEWF